jgi:SAM-dependent methyltransferase
MDNNILSKKHWNDFNKNYSGNWKGTSKEALSRREVEFVNRYLKKSIMRKILDIGVGNGRIMQNIIENSCDDSKIYGVDLSDKMVEVCKDKFKNNQKVKSINVCDVSENGIYFDETFDFISAIRVVKYNKNWIKMIKNIHNKLNAGGVFVFSVLNKNSLSRFSDYGIPVYLTSKEEMRVILKNINFEILEITSFSKLPAFLYLYFINNVLYSKILTGIEKVLEVLIGKTFMGKEYFIAVRKIP